MTPTALPAVASLALATLIDTKPGPAIVLGVSDPAVWMAKADGVLVVSTTDAVRLPNSVVVAPAASDRPFVEVRPGEEAIVGGGAVGFQSLTVRVVRWWDPVPALQHSRPGEVAAVVGTLDGAVPGIPDQGLETSLAVGDEEAVLGAALRLIGFGNGLTPMGDDLLAGAVAGMLLIGRSLGDEGCAASMQRIEGPVIEHAALATTTFSAALLGHAFRGEVATPAAGLLAALAGRGDAVAAAKELLEVGHSSGPALAAGILAGARAAIERSS
jgi:hypothetical protein